MEIMTILWREFRFFKHRFMKITTSQMITPILYLITFGIGLGNMQVQGQPYLYFLIPGLLAMTTMRNSYSAVSMRISIARLHEMSFEKYLYAPIRVTYLVLGYVLAGALRGVYAGLFVYLIGLISGASLTMSFSLVFVVFLNGIIFSSLGFLAAMMIDTHYDLNRFTNMIITPMSFLCGAFYSVSGLPFYFKWVIELLPLTHTTRLIRRLIFGYGIDGFSLLIAILYATTFIVIAIRYCYEEIDA